MANAPLPDPTNRRQLRRRLRQQRRALSPRAQRQAAAQLAQLLQRQPLWARAKRIGFYLANDGEIDPAPLLQAALQLGKQCYLPVLRPLAQGRLWYLRYRADTPLQPNRFGIPEPRRAGPPVALHSLDLVLTPLVGFDADGGRLGMGGGFYDRSFAFKAQQPGLKPLLLGLAHSCQQLPAAPRQRWDVPLQGVATEQGIYRGAGASGREFLQRDLLPKRH